MAGRRALTLAVELGLVGLMAGCGGPDEVATDAAPVDVPADTISECAGCNPLSPPGQQGCPADQKCTWVVLTDTPELVGLIACVPDGNVDLGQPCTPSAESQADDCKAGLVCLDGTCHDICGLDGNSGCAIGTECAVYEGLFGCGPDPVAGACLPGCDPVTQRQFDGSDCGTSQGCYVVLVGDTHAVCAGAGSIPVGQIVTGTVYANSCVPGAEPRYTDHTKTVVECGGLCRPNDVTSTLHQADEEGVAPDSCTARWGAPAASDPTAGESCRYLWGREQTPSPYGNAIGWCFPHARTWYDSDGDQVADTPTPRCTDLTDGDVVPPVEDPPVSDALSFWCRALPPAARTLPVAPATPRLDRLASWRRPIR